MDTNSKIRAAAAAVTGARHLRSARNGQDAAATWTGVRPGGARADDVVPDEVWPDRAKPAREALGAIVVCDGCGSGGSSEVGARLGAQLVIAALSARLAAGARPSDPALWAAVRAEVCGALARLVEAMPGDREQIVHEYFLFTIVAAAVAGDEIGVWAIGDGACAIAGTGIAAAPPRVLGPFADNQPPYLAYDLLDAAAPAYLETACSRDGTVVVATDGVAELGLETFTEDAGIARFLRHPDALRRRLAVLARSTERVEWTERRTIRTPAALQDDGALAVLRWTAEEPS
jgi:hypothetical protein